ncbi:MAG: response regulator, partial [Bryocella sp.]
MTPSASEPIAPNENPVLLTAARLSTLRHDMRTPFNQIIGYAEMTGEDGEDSGAADVTQNAAKLAATAHDLLARIASELTGEPAQITPSHLETLRTISAPAVEHLSQLAVALHSSVITSTSLPQETVGNVDKLEAALDHLRSRLAATITWHDADTSPEPLQSALATSAPPQVQPYKATATAPTMGTILIVDDHLENRDLLRQRLDREGFETAVAADGLTALSMLEQQRIDLVLLDVLMPGMNGIEVLQRIKSSDTLKSIPVIMISSLDEIERVVQCIETGAEDYLTKPFNPVLLRARIGVTLERKRLRDEEEHQRIEMQQMFAALTQERKNAHDLLLNILPEKVAKDLQQGHCAPMYFEDCTIGFTDFVGFTLSTENMAAELLVEELHTFFTAFDLIMERYGLEKMKTIGDSYMFASGLPRRHPANPVNALLAALELLH